MAVTAKKKKTEITGPDDIDWSKAKLVGRGTKTGKRFDLRSLRVALGKTQVEVARAAEMEQADVSRLESREDIKVSTLERYAAALGGKVEIAVVIGARRYLVTV